jgi:hypothetical protein
MFETTPQGWKPPKIWRGSTCVILGGGPSLATVNLALIKQRRVIAVNNAYGDPVKDASGKTINYVPRPWVEACWFGDSRWFPWHRQWLKKYPGILACCCPSLVQNRDGIKVLRKSRSRQGIEEKPGQVSWNGNSGASAINFAYHLGVKRILLLGFDMQRVGDQANWHDDHPALKKNPYAYFLKAFGSVAKDAKRLGLEIVNCSPDSALEVFEKVSLEEALK